ncbi:MAG: hypothetical protein K0Q79_2115 [Flavipsychrobacter sp.]|jgi:hypothetical protein|nr:hypothetical protein [Flavipsychrobacter sp.]
MRRILILLAFLLVCNFSKAQVCRDFAIELYAVPSTSPVQITLKWKPVGFGTPTYSIYKKSRTATSWGSAIATLPSTDTDYVDGAVIIDSSYEYYVKGVGSTITSAGFIYAGIRAPAIHYRGTMILVVDSTFTVPCAAGITKLMDDLSGDGWQVIRHDFLRTKTVADVKAAIVNDYTTYPNVKAVLLLGHVAVPHSGDMNPDAHTDHKGAWSADVFYGSISGSWTDVTVNNITSSNPANRNTPGDGKYDQTSIPATVELQVGRVDVYDMPAFSSPEVTLMNNYLSKDHLYKMDSIAVLRKAVISDNFGVVTAGPGIYESFAASGWRNFAPLVGRDSVSTTSSLISDLAATPYQWSYGCGGGSYTSASGIGNTTNFASSACNGIFTMLFGSYFGDWNTTNNFLRAPLCSNPPMLTNCWAGRPQWFFHHMALGLNIGYSAWQTQNNHGFSPTYYLYPDVGAGWVHVGLMGDLSLRTDYVKPVLNMNVTAATSGGANVTWTASPDPGVIGYYVYRADSAYGYYTRLNATMITALTYYDVTATTGLKYYMVRPVKLESTPSGGYYNLGIGATDTATITYSILQTAQVQQSVDVSVFPNPASDHLNVNINAGTSCVATMYVVNITGQVSDLVTKQLQDGDNRYMLNIASYTPGMYMLVVKTGDKQVTKQWVKQ